MLKLAADGTFVIIIDPSTVQAYADKAAQSKYKTLGSLNNANIDSPRLCNVYALCIMSVVCMLSHVVRFLLHALYFNRPNLH